MPESSFFLNSCVNVREAIHLLYHLQCMTSMSENTLRFDKLLAWMSNETIHLLYHFVHLFSARSFVLKNTVLLLVPVSRKISCACGHANSQMTNNASNKRERHPSPSPPQTKAALPLIPSTTKQDPPYVVHGADGERPRRSLGLGLGVRHHLRLDASGAALGRRLLSKVHRSLEEPLAMITPPDENNRVIGGGEGAPVLAIHTRHAVRK